MTDVHGTVTDQHRRFLQRLRNSKAAVERVAEHLRASGFEVSVPELRFAPTAAEHEDYSDDGDLYCTKDGITRRVEVKGLSVEFTGRGDWPFRGEVFVNSKRLVDRYIGAPPDAYFSVSRDLVHAAIIRRDTADWWYPTDRVDRNTGNMTTFIVCPLERVEFRRLRREVPVLQAAAEARKSTPDETQRGPEMTDAHPNAPGNGPDQYDETMVPRVIDRPPARLVANTTLAADLAAAEIDQQIATARRYPRQLSTVVRTIREMATVDEATADACVYALPRGNKPIVGASVGFAGIVAQSWGNCRDGSRITFINREDKLVIAEGAFHDLETNRLCIVPVSRRISDSRGRIYSDDMIQVTAMAAAAIGRRNAILNGVPRSVWHPSFEAALRMVRGSEEQLPERRARAFKALAKFGVDEKTVLKFFGLASVQDIGIELMPTLRAIHTQLRDNVITVEELFDPRRMGSVGFERVENPLDDQPRKAPPPAKGGQPAAEAQPREGEQGPAEKPARKPRQAPKGEKREAPADKEGEPTPSTERAPSQQPDPGSGAGTTVGGNPKPEETPQKAQEEDPHAGLLDGPEPKTPEQYEARANRFIDGAQSARWLKDTWSAKPERALRGDCRIVEETFERIKERLDKRVRELEAAGK